MELEILESTEKYEPDLLVEIWKDALPDLDKRRIQWSYENNPAGKAHLFLLKDLEKEMLSLLPESPLLFPTDQTTDKSDAFMAAEIIREKLMTRVHQELPYGLTVEVEQYSHDEQAPGNVRDAEMA